MSPVVPKSVNKKCKINDTTTFFLCQIRGFSFMVLILLLLLFTYCPNSRILGMLYAKSTSFVAPFCMNFAKCVHTALKTLLLLVTE